MSIASKHHYLPQFYLDRWAKDGRLFRYIRPLGAAGELHGQWKSPKAVAYERDLYRLTDLDDPVESQALEMRFLQRIDDRAAIALSKLDNDEPGSDDDRLALAQFMISLMHRPPSRLADIRKGLTSQTRGAPYESLSGKQFDDSLKATANRLLGMLIESDNASSILKGFGVYKAHIKAATRLFLTSDRPITLSGLLIAPDAFMILPYAPDRIVILARSADIARSFASQNPNNLVTGINSAVVEQSQDVVIAADERATRMVEKLFMRPQAGRVFDVLGCIRRKSPFVDLRPKIRAFSRHRKNDARYL